MKASYVRLYADSFGESHFEDLHEELTETEFAPPAAPLLLSNLINASKAGFLAAPAGWVGDWHPSSGRNMFFVLTGEWEIQASDGEIRRFGPGSVLKVEDTSGKGHTSRVIGNNESVAGIVQLAD